MRWSRSRDYLPPPAPAGRQQVWYGRSRTPSPPSMKPPPASPGRTGRRQPPSALNLSQHHAPRKKVAVLHTGCLGREFLPQSGVIIGSGSIWKMDGPDKKIGGAMLYVPVCTVSDAAADAILTCVEWWRHWSTDKVVGFPVWADERWNLVLNVINASVQWQTLKIRI